MQALPQRQTDFPPTRWSLVVELKSESDGRRESALAQLCEAYWYPVYAFVRRSGKNPHDAHDLTQGLFLDLLERDTFADADPQLGRMRSFLLLALKRFLAKSHRYDQTLKRGAGKVPISIDEREAEGRYLAEPAHQETPELLFERQWAASLFTRVHDRLRDHFSGAGKPEQFAALSPFLSKGEGEQNYAAIAEELGMSEGAVGVAVFRMRKRFRLLLEEEIEDTLADGEDVTDEVRHLHHIFQNRIPAP